MTTPVSLAEEYLAEYRAIPKPERGAWLARLPVERQAALLEAVNVLVALHKHRT